MDEVRNIIVGRLKDCDVVLSDPTVSGRHARLSWEDAHVVVEDLGSANGTFVRGERVRRARVRPGDEVRLGRARLPWSSRRLRRFLRTGALGDTQRGTPVPGRRFVCGACGRRGQMPKGFRGGALRCAACRARLRVGRPRRRPISAVGGAAALLAGALATAAWLWQAPAPGGALGGGWGLSGDRWRGVGADSPQEASIRVHTVPHVVEALDPTAGRTRNAAIRIAAADGGPYKLEQVARVWSYVRDRWRYVNDPHDREYFAKASETIENGYIGDCDDFAIVVASLITAIGGEARVVMMDGPRGGHAYAEACVKSTPAEVRRRLERHYARHEDVPETVEAVHYRPSAQCPVWLNLDWNAGIPGGPYEPEHWAVAINPEGHTRTLAPAVGSTTDQGRSGGRMRTSSPPDR